MMVTSVERHFQQYLIYHRDGKFYWKKYRSISVEKTHVLPQATEKT